MAFTSIPGTPEANFGNIVLAYVPASEANYIDAAATLTVTASLSATPSLLFSGVASLGAAATMDTTASLLFACGTTMEAVATLVCFGFTEEAETSTGVLATGASVSVNADVIPKTVGWISAYLLREWDSTPSDIAGSTDLDGSGTIGRFQSSATGRMLYTKAWGIEDHSTKAYKNEFVRRDATAAFHKHIVIQDAYVIQPEMVAISGTVTIEDVATTLRATNSVLGAWLSRIALIDAPTYAMVPSVVIEVLKEGTGDSNTILSNCTIESLVQPIGNARVSSVCQEVLRGANNSIIDQVTVESIFQQLVSLRTAIIDQHCIEVMHSVKSSVFHTQMAHEILRGVPPNRNAVLTTAVIEVARQRTEIDSTIARAQQLVSERLFRSNEVKLNMQQFSLEIAKTPLVLNALITQSNVEYTIGGDPIVEASQISGEITHFNLGNVCSGLVCGEILIKLEYDPTASALANNPRYTT